MKLITLVLTFLLSAQLVYANATVCANYGKCSQMESSKNSAMKDCPMHANQNQNKEKKTKTKSQCKCCAVLTLETSFNTKPTIESVLSFIEFQFLEKSTQSSASHFLRPPIA